MLKPVRIATYSRQYESKPFVKFICDTKGFEFIKRSNGEVIPKWIIFDDYSRRPSQLSKIINGQHPIIGRRKKEIMDY